MKFSQKKDVYKNVVGTPASVKSLFASAFPSKCGTLYLPNNVGMRLSDSGTHSRLSSSVDQMACLIPVALAAAAIIRASAISFSGEK
jgi:hypothetical protein